MRTRKMRLMSFVLALAMMLAIAPVSAFAADEDITTPDNAKKITNITIDGSGKPVIQINETKDESGKVTTTVVTSPDNVVCSVNADNGFRTYVNKDPENNNADVWAIPETLGLIAIRPGYSYEGAGSKVVSTTMTVAGNLNGGIYSGSVSASTKATTKIGTITDGVFQAKAEANGGEIRGGLFLGEIAKGTAATSKISGGVFARDPGSTENTKRKLKANGCRIYTESAYDKYNSIADNTRVYIENTTSYPEAYVVGNQKIVLTINNPTFDHWEVKTNDTVVKVDANSSVVIGSTTYTDISDSNDNHVLKFTMPNDDVEVSSVIVPIEFHMGDDNLPEYKGKTYMGNLDLDGWKLTPATSGEYPYTLTVKQGATVDLENRTVAWRINTYGTVKNGITSGNVVTMKNTDGTYGRVENIAFRMNVYFGSQDDPITWVTLKNATACEVFSEIVGVIGQQTITVKPNISKDHFTGWTYSGEMSDAVAKQLEEQKNQYEITLELDGDSADTIALVAKSDVDTFDITMLDGKASVTSAAPGETVTITMDDSEIPEGMSFDHWVISPDVELEGGFKATDRTTSFKMPAQELTIYASLRTDSDDGMDAMTVVAGVAIGAGAAVLTYHIGTELYAKQVLGEGVAVPKTREDVALKAWELAGKPAVELNGEPLSETAQAEKWAVESGLMQNVDGSFNGSKKMSKLKALRTLDAAKKLA